MRRRVLSFSVEVWGDMTLPRSLQIWGDLAVGVIGLLLSLVVTRSMLCIARSRAARWLEVAELRGGLELMIPSEVQFASGGRWALLPRMMF